MKLFKIDDSKYFVEFDNEETETVKHFAYARKITVKAVFEELVSHGLKKMDGANNRL